VFTFLPMRVVLSDNAGSTATGGQCPLLRSGCSPVSRLLGTDVRSTYISWCDKMAEAITAPTQR
jgi:hypothetical protein